MALSRHSMTITSNADGTFSETTPFINGYLVGLLFVLPGSGGFTNTATLTITGDATGHVYAAEGVIGNSSDDITPKRIGRSGDGFGSDAGAATADPIPVTEKLVLSGTLAGNENEATFVIIVDGDINT